MKEEYSTELTGLKTNTKQALETYRADLKQEYAGLLSKLRTQLTQAQALTEQVVCAKAEPLGLSNYSMGGMPSAPQTKEQILVQRRNEIQRHFKAKLQQKKLQVEED